MCRLAAMTVTAQTAKKNLRKALTSELLPITDMLRPRGKTPFAFLVPQNRFRFLEKNRRWCGAIFLARSQRRSRWSMVGRSTGARMVVFDVAHASLAMSRCPDGY